MSKRSIAVIVASFFTVLIAFSVRYSYGILLPEMMPYLHINKTEAGLIYSSYFIAYTIASPILGIMADRFDNRKILTLFVVILGMGALLMAFSGSLITASLFFLLAGIGHAACWTPVVALVQRWVKDKYRGTALTIADLGSSAGIAVWSALMPLIVIAFTWRGGWISLGLTCLVIAILNFILVRDRPEESRETFSKFDNHTVKKNIYYAFTILYKDMKFWLIGFSYLLAGFTVLIPFTFLPVYAVQSLGVTYEIAARLVTIIAISGIIGKLILGPLSDKVARIIVMMVCCGIMSLGGVGILLFKDILFTSVFTAIFGLGYGAVWPVYAAVTADYFPKQYSGSVIGIWTLFLGIGSMLAPVLAGYTIDITGEFNLAFFLQIATSFIALCLLIPILLNSCKMMDKKA